VIFLGIEIGGTKLQLALGRGDGQLMALWRGTVEPARGADGIREQITRAVPELLNLAGLRRDQLRGIGLGFGGPVDDATRTVIKSHQIEGWNNFPLADWLGGLLDMPAVLGNDADVAGLGEALFGAGKGYSPVFYITLGSGIGGGLIIDGQIYRGAGRGAAEIGHLQFKTYWIMATKSLDPGRAQTLEDLASGWGLADTARRCVSAEQPIHSLLYPLVHDASYTLTAKDVIDAVQRGDAFAESVWRQSVDVLADAVCHVIALLCPRRIVIGGGVSLVGEDLLFKPLRTQVAERVFKPFAACYTIVPAALGEEMVVHGALALARQRLGA
jgi:glucokinase